MKVGDKVRILNPIPLFLPEEFTGKIVTVERLDSLGNGVFYVGGVRWCIYKDTHTSSDGSYIWRLVDETTKPLEEKDLTKATKNDKLDNKEPLEFLRMDGISEMCRVFAFGATKYGKDNYLLGMEQHRLTAAALRHILAHQQGDTIDPESGLPHLAHAMCCLSMYFSMKSCGTLIEEADD